MVGCNSQSQEKATTSFLEINNVKTVATMIVSNDESLSNIAIGKITFQTNTNCTTSVEVNGKHYYSGEGTLHQAYINGTVNRIEYTIHAKTDNGIGVSKNEVLICDYSEMFFFYGNLNKYLDYLIPVVISIYENLSESKELLKVILIGGIDYFSLFEKDNIFTMRESTSKEVYDSLMRWYEKNIDVLKSAWPFFSDNQIKVASIMNIVSHLWHFGNFERITRTGCVQVNEMIDADSADYIFAEYEGESPLYWKTAVGMADFINSVIGCCTDHAFLSKAILEEAGFESVRVETPVHWLTEVSIDSIWHTVDASAGILVNASMDTMCQGTKRTAYLFLTPYMYFDSEEHFAASFYPQFANFTMSTGLKGGYVKQSEIQIIDGYRDDPPYANELEQINGR
jgi:hypothetical protein